MHDLTRLPRSLIGLTNGHEGGHPFLADDFVRACISAAASVNAWVAARLHASWPHRARVGEGKWHAARYPRFR